MGPRPLDRRWIFVSLLLHAAVGVLLLICVPGSPLRPVVEPPPLTVMLLPPDMLSTLFPPAPVLPRSSKPGSAKPVPDKLPPVHPHTVPPEPALPAEPPEIQTHEVQPAAPQAQPSASAPTLPAPSLMPLPGAVQGARAIYQPRPTIPDDLREEALSVAAVARFHIAVDGTATVELVTPTRNPRLNQVLLDALKRWRFFPAVQDGRPVASTQDLPISVVVK